VAEDVRDRAHIDALREHHGRGRMPQVSPHDDLLFSLMLAVFVAPRSGPMEDCRVFRSV
jgi:hypothetical protein